MLLKIVYLLTCRVFSLAVLVFCGDWAKDAELLVLRHENAVLRRNVGRVRYEAGDGVWFAAVAQLPQRRCWTGIFRVTPATLLAWHRKLAGRKYDTSKRRKPGRPPTVPGIARLVVRLAFSQTGGSCTLTDGCSAFMCLVKPWVRQKPGPGLNYASAYAAAGDADVHG